MVGRAGEIPPYMRTRDSIHRKNSPFSWSPSGLLYQPEHNRYICPAGQVLNYGGRNPEEPHLCLHRDPQTLWGMCAVKAQCTSGAFRFLAIHMDEPSPATGTGVGEHARVREGTTAGKRK